eukprot:1656946-Heterocapsa_arctica.AAC.1
MHDKRTSSEIVAQNVLVGGNLGKKTGRTASALACTARRSADVGETGERTDAGLRIGSEKQIDKYI